MEISEITINSLKESLAEMGQFIDKMIDGKDFPKYDKEITSLARLMGKIEAVIIMGEAK